MAFGRLFSKETRDYPEEGEDYMELDMMASALPGQMGSTSIKIDYLNDFADTERVLKQIRTGSIVFLKIKGLKEKDMGDLKRAVEKLKKAVMANNGDIVGVEQDWVILSPRNTNVSRI